MARMHEAVVQMSSSYFERHRRRVHATPKSFLSFLETFGRLYQNKLKHITVLSQAIAGGLQKMSDANADVNTMKVRPTHVSLTLCHESCWLPRRLKGPLLVNYCRLI